MVRQHKISTIFVFSFWYPGHKNSQNVSPILVPSNLSLPDADVGTGVVPVEKLGFDVLEKALMCPGARE